MPERKHTGLAAALLVSIWPFVYLFPYVIPIRGKILHIGNDFDILYYSYKVYLLDLLSNFQVPLWSPSEAAGFPFYSNPFAQTFYPLNIPLAVFYKLAGGYSFLDHQWFTVLGISIFALGCYLWLRALGFRLEPALFVALVIPVSYKVTEIIRFPNAIHSMCWYPWILLAITKLLAPTNPKKAIAYGGVLFFAGFSLATGGYPYYLYYALFLIFPYILLIWGKNLPIRDWKGFGKSLIPLAVSGILVLISIAPFILQLANLMAQTHDRGGNSYHYATNILFNFQDTIGSLTYPPASQTEGWYHFGFVGLYLILLFLFSPRDAQSPDWLHSRWLKVALVGWFFVISYITYGKESFLFSFLWHYLPGFSSLRAWGRMNIILIPLIAWLLALAYEHFQTLVQRPAGAEPTSRKILWRSTLIILAAFVDTLGIQAYFINARIYDEYWKAYYLGAFSRVRSTLSSPLSPLAGQIFEPTRLEDFLNAAFVFWAIVSFLVCLFFLLSALKFPRGPRRLLFLSLFILSVASTWMIAPWAWASGWENIPSRVPQNVQRNFKKSFNEPRINVYGTITNSSQYNAGIVANWYFERYVQFLVNTQNEPEATKRLLGMKNGQKIFFTSTLDHESVQSFLSENKSSEYTVKIKTYTGDALQMIITTPDIGYVSFIDNWDPAWKAAVDGTPVEVTPLFGTFKAVRVPAGEHTVLFAYCPQVFSVLNPYCSRTHSIRP